MRREATFCQPKARAAKKLNPGGGIVPFESPNTIWRQLYNCPRQVHAGLFPGPPGSPRDRQRRLPFGRRATTTLRVRPTLRDAGPPLWDGSLH